VGCDKTLLPNGVSSKRTDDIRWFINYQHAVSLSGDAGSVTEKELSSVTSTPPTMANPSQVVLTYDGSYDYPYGTTMENNASSWLIYNPDDPTATRNKFSVKFNKTSTGWSGAHETNVTTKDPSTVTTNRRTRW